MMFYFVIKHLKQKVSVERDFSIQYGTAGNTILKLLTQRDAGLGLIRNTLHIHFMYKHHNKFKPFIRAGFVA